MSDDPKHNPDIDPQVDGERSERATEADGHEVSVLCCLVDVKASSGAKPDGSGSWQVLVAAESAAVATQYRVRHASSAGSAVREAHAALDDIVEHVGQPMAAVGWQSAGSGQRWRNIAHTFDLDYVRDGDPVCDRP